MTNLFDIPLGSVRTTYNDEDNTVSLYLHTFNIDPTKEWNFKVGWPLDGLMAGPRRPTLGHLQMLIDMAERKFKND